MYGLLALGALGLLTEDDTLTDAAFQVRRRVPHARVLEHGTLATSHERGGDLLCAMFGSTTRTEPRRNEIDEEQSTSFEDDDRSKGARAIDGSKRPIESAQAVRVELNGSFRHMRALRRIRRPRASTAAINSQ